MFKEQRVNPRERLTLPIDLADGLRALTRDISAAGLFFVLQGQHVLHGPVEFELRVPEFSMRFSSSGEIVRVEHGADSTGVAVRFIDPRMDVLEQESA